MRTHTAHSYRGLALFAGVLLGLVLFGGASLERAEAGCTWQLGSTGYPNGWFEARFCSEVDIGKDACTDNDGDGCGPWNIVPYCPGGATVGGVSTYSNGYSCSIGGSQTTNPAGVAPEAGACYAQRLTTVCTNTCDAGWSEEILTFDGPPNSGVGWCNGTSYGRCAPGTVTGSHDPSAYGSVQTCCRGAGELGWIRTCPGSPTPPPTVTACSPNGSFYLWNGINWDDYGTPDWSVSSYEAGLISGVVSRATPRTLSCGAPPALPVPTANLTVNSGSNVTVDINDPLNYNWGSTNATSYTSTYTVSPGTCPHAPGAAPYPWNNGQTSSGSQTDYADASMAGCTYTITYSVTGPGGSASDSVVVRINAGAPVCSYTTYWSSCNASCGGGTRYEYYNNVTGSCSASIKNGWPTGASEACNTQACPPATYPLTVTKGGAGVGTVTSNLAGINCPGDCTQDYSTGAVVTLMATPAGGSAFSGWSGACSGAALTCQVTMNVARSVTATFTVGAPVLAPTASLTIDGYPLQQNVTLPPSTPHTKRWTSTNGSTYSSTYLWSGATCPISGQTGNWVANDAGNTADNTTDPANLGCTASITYTVTNSAGVSAQSTLNLTVACPVGQFWDGDSCEVVPGPTPQCSDGVDNGDPEDSIADYPADPGCSDANDDDETDSLPPGCVTLPCGGGGGPDGLQVTVVGLGHVGADKGNIDCSGGETCNDAYADGTVVTLTATPDAGETFTGWSGACSGSNSSCSVTISGWETVTATFTGGGSGIPECSDGIDNDGDGLVDSSADPECSDDSDDSESSLGGIPTLNASPRQHPIGGGDSNFWWDANGGGACTLTGVINGTYQTVDPVPAIVEVSNPYPVAGITASTEYKLECSGGDASLRIFVDGTQRET